MAILIAAGGTDVGRVREQNDDAYRIYAGQEFKIIQRGLILAVADGIGSYRAGGQAAQIAVDQLALYFRLPGDQFEGPKTLQSLIFKANEAITRMRTGQKAYYGMGCTLTTLLVNQAVDRAIIYQVGDSMAYLERGGVLSTITTPQNAEDSSLSNHMGLGAQMNVERVKFTVHPGDTLLLCSDGVAGSLSDDELLAGMTLSNEPQPCNDAILAQAKEKSEDNVTAVIGKIR
jgi:serine/threonine protein phosphatase PrpC